MPSFTRISEQQAWDALVELNGRFNAGALAPELRAFLRSRGHNSDNCVLVRLAPDSGGTWIGTLVVSGGSTYEFDFDPNDAEACDLSALERLYLSGAQQRQIAMAEQYLTELGRDATPNKSFERTREG